MHFSFVFKMIFIYALNFSSTQKDYISSNNIGVKDTVKESLNIGDLRVNDVVTYNDDILLNSTIQNYLINNNLRVDDVKFDIAVNDNIVTIIFNTNKNLFEQISKSSESFSYKVERSF